MHCQSVNITQNSLFLTTFNIFLLITTSFGPQGFLRSVLFILRDVLLVPVTLVNNLGADRLEQLPHVRDVFVGVHHEHRRGHGELEKAVTTGRFIDIFFVHIRTKNYNE